MQYRLLWLFLITLVSAIAVACVSQYAPAPKLRESNLSVADGIVVVGEYIDLARESNDKLYFRYCTFSDSGVELERQTNGKTRWIQHCEGLGVEHFGYQHQVSVVVDGDKVLVYSKGSAGLIFEERDLANGNVKTRSIK